MVVGSVYLWHVLLDHAPFMQFASFVWSHRVCWRVSCGTRSLWGAAFAFSRWQPGRVMLIQVLVWTTLRVDDAASFDPGREGMCVLGGWDEWHCVEVVPYMSGQGLVSSHDSVFPKIIRIYWNRLWWRTWTSMDQDDLHVSFLACLWFLWPMGYFVCTL